MHFEKTIIQHYALAVFNLARERGELERLEQDALLLAEVAANTRNVKIRQFLESPVYLTRDKEELLRKALASAVSPMMLNLHLMLIRRGRILYASRIMARILELIDESKGIVNGIVTTAVSLGEAERAALLESLKTVAGAGLRLRYLVDPSIMGGVIVQYGDTLIDDSIRTRLQKMKARLATLDLRPAETVAASA